ncbi:MAG: hypothetical protein R3B89_31995 [Polyangiaceae bacterium]
MSDYRWVTLRVYVAGSSIAIPLLLWACGSSSPPPANPTPQLDTPSAPTVSAAGAPSASASGAASPPQQPAAVVTDGGAEASASSLETEMCGGPDDALCPPRDDECACIARCADACTSCEAKCKPPCSKCVEKCEGDENCAVQCLPVRVECQTQCIEAHPACVTACIDSGACNDEP